MIKGATHAHLNQLVTGHEFFLPFLTVNQLAWSIENTFEVLFSFCHGQNKLKIRISVHFSNLTTKLTNIKVEKLKECTLLGQNRLKSHIALTFALCTNRDSFTV